MPKKPLIRSNILPYHVFNRVNNREWFPLPIERVWDLFCRELYAIQMEREARIHTFVLMTNHFHLSISTPTYDLGVIMQNLLRSATQTFNLESGRSGHLFSGRYKGSLITSAAHYANVTKYIYRNPVKAGLTEKVEHYPFSTLHGLMGATHLPLPLYRPDPSVDDDLMPDNVVNLLTWLNTPFRNEDDLALTAGLRRAQFSIKGRGYKRSPSILDSRLG